MEIQLSFLTCLQVPFTNFCVIGEDCLQGILSMYFKSYVSLIFQKWCYTSCVMGRKPHHKKEVGNDELVALATYPKHPIPSVSGGRLFPHQEREESWLVNAISKFVRILKKGKNSIFPASEMVSYFRMS